MSGLLWLLGSAVLAKGVAPDSPARVAAEVEGIKTAELGHMAAFDMYVACGDRDRAEIVARMLAGRPYRWEHLPWRNCIDRLGWSPDGVEAYGVYWIDVSADGHGFTVHGVVDLDGDGTLMRWAATQDQTVKLLTPDGVK